jgi:hypothetical protein
MSFFKQTYSVKVKIGEYEHSKTEKTDFVLATAENAMEAARKVANAFGVSVDDILEINKSLRIVDDNHELA